jgi:endonuclease G, mitochondrial
MSCVQLDEKPQHMNHNDPWFDYQLGVDAWGEKPPHKPLPWLLIIVKLLIIVALLSSIVAVSLSIRYAMAEECAAAPLGLPDIPHAVTVSHPAWCGLMDPARKEPIIIAYRLTRADTLGCASRAAMAFHVDTLIPAEDQGKPSDYTGSGQDLGHMRPAEDGAVTLLEMADTFVMTNVAPQLPGLNRQGWERGEEMVRAWAWQFGEVYVEVGPIYSTKGTSIGADALPVPVSFYKIVVNASNNQVFAFEMQNTLVPKMGSLDKYVMPIDGVQANVGYRIPLPAGAVEQRTAWPVDLAGYRKARAQACVHK